MENRKNLCYGNSNAILADCIWYLLELSSFLTKFQENDLQNLSIHLACQIIHKYLHKAVYQKNQGKISNDRYLPTKIPDHFILATSSLLLASKTLSVHIPNQNELVDFFYHTRPIVNQQIHHNDWKVLMQSKNSQISEVILNEIHKKEFEIL